VAEVSLLLEAPNGVWSDHVESLIRSALRGRASVRLGVFPDAMWDVTEVSACFRSGVAVFDEPEEAILAALTAALRDFELETRTLDSGATQLVVRPLPSGREG
jgi:hypothetical protein